MTLRGLAVGQAQYSALLYPKEHLSMT